MSQIGYFKVGGGGVYVFRVCVQGVSVQGVYVLGVSVQGGTCPGVFCPVTLNHTYRGHSNNIVRRCV